VKVGFVGLGHMGAPMSRHVLAAGHDLVVHDLRRPAAAALEAAGAGDAAAGSGWNVGAAVDAVAGLAGRVGLTQRLADLGITRADFGRIAADALDDEVLANAPRQPTAADIRVLLLASDQE
jgi:alcohol dehydrogenase class IV